MYYKLPLCITKMMCLSWADKPLLMLQSVRRMYRLSSDAPEVHACVIRLALATRQWSTLPPQCKQVLAHGLSPITCGRSPATINQQFMDAHPHHLPSIFQGMFLSLLSVTIYIALKEFLTIYSWKKEFIQMFRFQLLKCFDCIKSIWRRWECTLTPTQFTSHCPTQKGKV